METFISDLAETYIKKRQTRGENVQFVEFEIDANQGASIGMHSDGVGGKIVYQLDDHCESEEVFVKTVTTEDQCHTYRPTVVIMFHNEIRFYEQVLPFLNSLRSIEHLIPQFLDFKRRTQQGETIAIMFKRLGPEWRCNNYNSLLDYAHLSLMMRKLGEFHAYSFAAKSQDESQFLKMSSVVNDNVSISIDMFQAAMKQTLERCLQPLRHLRQYVEAVPRVEQLIRNYSDIMKRTYMSSAQDQHYVLGHLSYNQSNVLFTYANGVPVDMKIMDWQSPAFVTLGADLGCVLYTDASQQTRDEYWERLLDDYCDSLRTTFDNNSVPSRDQVLVELKKGICAAIFIVTYRANKLHTKSGPQDSEAQWNDEFVTDMLKDMIDRGFL